MTQFKEPKPNPIVIMLCRLVFPFWLNLKEHLSISVNGSRENLIAFLRRRRAVVLLNHPDRQDPFMLFELANKMHEEFYCIAARECFDWDGGWRGWLFQSLGCYSVERGKTDFHSIATTKKVLLEGRRKLLVFPEAEITADEEHVHDLQSAIFHIALSVQQELTEQNSNHLDDPVSIIPAAIHFSFTGELNTALKPSMQKIEKQLALHNSRHTSLNSRIDTIVDKYLSRVFHAYEFEKPQASLEQLTERAAVQLVQKIESRFGIAIDDKLAPIDQLYVARNKIGNHKDDASVARYPNEFHCAGIPKPCIASDLERIERLLVLQRMLQHAPSNILCCRILDFIESELFGVITPKGRQSGTISIGTPIEVASFVEQYRSSKEEGVKQLSEHFRQSLQQMLLEITTEFQNTQA